MVTGVLSPAGAFNHPDATICHETGVRLGAHRTLRLVTRARPGLGVLIADDGTSWTVDHDLVIGRNPTTDRRVVAGEAEPVVLTDGARGLSRRHLWIRLVGWDTTIVDLATHNGTRVLRGDRMLALTGDQPLVLADGDVIVAGRRALRWRPTVR